MNSYPCENHIQTENWKILGECETFTSSLPCFFEYVLYVMNQSLSTTSKPQIMLHLDGVEFTAPTILCPVLKVRVVLRV